MGQKSHGMSLPDVKLRVSPSEIAPLTERLTLVGYDEPTISELLGIWDLSQLDAMELPNYVWQARRAGTELADFVLLFLLGEGLPRQRLANLLGSDLVSALSHCNILFRRSGMFYCNLVLYPCAGKFLFTDYWVTQGPQLQGQVYELGTDSFVLARVTPRHGHERALDLCTGSGVHAVLSAGACRSSVAVDINPRALLYTQLNAALNSVDVTTHLADLYSPVPKERFDLITANPPYVPSPDREVRVHRSAGESGEEISERLVAGLPEHLNEGGLFSMVLEYPVLQDEEYLDRLERWLGQDRGWGIALLSFGETSVATYIKNHMGSAPDYNSKFNEYLESYSEQNITSIDFANVFILREKGSHPNWKLKKKTIWPNVDLTQNIADWLSNLSRFNSPDWQPDPDWKPSLSRYYKTLWRDWDLSKGFLESTPENWVPPESLSSDEAELLSRMRGRLSVADLRRGWLEEGREESSFLQAFRGIGARFALA